MDSAAFSEVVIHGGYRAPPAAFAAEACAWTARVPGCVFVASQDYMCEPFVLEKTGLTIPDHQLMTIERYDAIMAAWTSATPVLPVLQGFAQADYLKHLDDYGDRLAEGAWVGVGSVCKRQGAIAMVEDLLGSIKERRPDLRLHGFGVKLTALKSQLIRDLLYSADSMAWSFSARKQGRDVNDWREAENFVKRVSEPAPVVAQPSLFGWS